MFWINSLSKNHHLAWVGASAKLLFLSHGVE